MTKEFIYGIIYSEFDEIRGPIPCYFVPKSILNNNLGISVATKTIDMFDEADLNSHSLAVIPFTSENKKGLVSFFEWIDSNRRGGKGMGSLTLLFEENKDVIFYKYMKDFEIIFRKIIEKITELKNSNADADDVLNALNDFYNKCINLLNELFTQEVGVQDESDAFPEEDEETQSLKFKIIIVGDGACGKTSTVLRFTDKAFRATYLPTLGVNITEKAIIIDKFKINLMLWDIAGQIKFQTLRRQFYKESAAGLLLFDLTRPNTLENIENWYRDIIKYQRGEFTVILCGNKNDLVEDRKIRREDAEELAKKLNMEYIETSALTGENVDDVFYRLSEKLIKNK